MEPADEGGVEIPVRPPPVHICMSLSAISAVAPTMLDIAVPNFVNARVYQTVETPLLRA